jgi:hypothetical protein
MSHTGRSALFIATIWERSMILITTAAGQQALAVQDALLTSCMRTICLLCDGQRSLGQVLGATAGLGACADDVRTLLELGWLRAGVCAPSDAPGFDMEGINLAQQQARYTEGLRWARQLAKGLGIRGLRLLVAVESAADYTQLTSLLPRIREAVGSTRAAILELVLLGDVQSSSPQPVQAGLHH